MKEPTKSPAKKSTAKKPTRDNPQRTQKVGSGFTVGQALELANTSVDTMKAYTEYKKEVEVTKRALIEGQKAITLGEQELEKARLTHIARLNELDNADRSDLRSHEEAMAELSHKERKLDTNASLQERVLAQLEAQQITAEEAALLLYGAQE
ncbi:hypothetical protein F3J24_18560 [Comamonas sp. Tr-654]|uniref:hypothetical protein n=1 Tax=Comamonas sp. Tr-654 TaxID=2608341 RepID=UPI001421AD65|nr:hypothetical protein [Comamonas sp. Tr-654]NIF85506.1 hypothetical protein [Comamonas sp. Tr-654]